MTEISPIELERRRKIGDAHRGKKRPAFSSEWSENLRGAHLAYYANGGAHPRGMLGKSVSKETRQKISIASSGRKHTPEARLKISLAKRGSKSHFWKGGVSKTNRTERQNITVSLEYRLWREAVFKRDDWTCQICSQKGGRLQADHIKRFSDFPELRLDINNGRTLCVPCHRRTDTWGHKPNRVVDQILKLSKK